MYIIWPVSSSALYHTPHNQYYVRPFECKLIRVCQRSFFRRQRFIVPYYIAWHRGPLQMRHADSRDVSRIIAFRDERPYKVWLYSNMLCQPPKVHYRLSVYCTLPSRVQLYPKSKSNLWFIHIFIYIYAPIMHKCYTSDTSAADQSFVNITSSCNIPRTSRFLHLFHHLTTIKFN